MPPKAGRRHAASGATHSAPHCGYSARLGGISPRAFGRVTAGFGIAGAGAGAVSCGSPPAGSPAGSSSGPANPSPSGPNPVDIQHAADPAPLDKVAGGFTSGTDPATHIAAVQGILDGGATPFLHFPQQDPSAAIDFYRTQVLPKLH